MAFRSDVLREFPSQIDKLLLFGSRVRGHARQHSDYDVAVVLKDDVAGTSLDRKLSLMAYPYILLGTHISAISVNARDVDPQSRYALGSCLFREGVELV
jgi:predicted nucleotidyltransferase